MRRVVFALMALFMLAFALPVHASEESEVPPESTFAYYVCEQDTQQVLVQRNSALEIDASLSARLMCAVTVLETAIDGRNISITDKITPIENSKSSDGFIKLYTSRTYTVDELLKAMLLENADNCARVLAYAVNPNTEYFVSLMNQKAVQLGMTGTFYANPDGTYNVLQRTTAYDMTLLYSYAIKNTQIRNIIQSELTHIWDNTAVFNPCSAAFESQALLNGSAAGGLMYTGSGGTEGQSSIMLSLTLSSQDSSSYSMKLILCFFCENGEDAAEFAKSIIQDCNSNYRKRKLFSVGDTVTTLTIADEDLELLSSTNLYSVMPVDVTNYIQAASYSFVNSDSSETAEIVPPVTQYQQIGTAHILLGDGTSHDITLIAGNTIRTQSKTVNNLISLVQNNLPMFIIIGVLLLIEINLGIIKIVYHFKNK